MDDQLGVYLSFPFCRAKCSFCNFASGVFAADRMQLYVDRLCAELRHASQRAEAAGANLPEHVDTVYFGGGTPSLLDPSHLHQIFASLRREFLLDRDAEITLEAAPGQLSDQTLEAAMHLGINRVSFGVQSFVDAEAAAVGRLHTGPQCHAEIARMHAAGVASVSLDLIAGLPHQTTSSWASSLGQAIQTGAEHMSVYLLEIDDSSRLGREALAGGTRYHADALPGDDAAADFYEMACAELGAAGLAQYEISNFARPGSASRHNLKYWNRQPYLGVGLDAHSMLRYRDGASDTRAVRWSNGEDLEVYLAGVQPENGLQVLDCSLQASTIDNICIEQAFEESFFLGLRLNDGVDLDAIGAAFGPWRLQHAITSLSEIETAGLIERRASRISLTAAGRLASNEVFSRLLVA